MMMSFHFRKLALTTHVTFSVGWLGAVGANLVLAAVGLVLLTATVLSVYQPWGRVGQTGSRTAKAMGAI